MTARTPHQRFFFFACIIFFVGVLQAQADIPGEHCDSAPFPGPWILGAGPIELDDECDFSVDFGAGLQQTGWLHRPAMLQRGLVETFNFQVGPSFPDLLVDSEFRFFDLNSPSGVLLRLMLRQEPAGFVLLGQWHGYDGVDGDRNSEGQESAEWHNLLPVEVAFDTASARGVSVVIARRLLKPGLDLVVYVDGDKTLSGENLMFSAVPTEARLGVITSPGPGALGAFSFRPIF